MNGGDTSETDESGIELGGSDISNLAVVEGENASTPYNSRKIVQINNTLDIDLARSMQVSSVWAYLSNMELGKIVVTTGVLGNVTTSYSKST